MNKIGERLIGAAIAVGTLFVINVSYECGRRMCAHELSEKLTAAAKEFCENQDQMENGND